MKPKPTPKPMPKPRPNPTKTKPRRASQRQASQKQTYQKIASERITILFQEAQKAFPSHPDRSNRYVQLARKIGMKYRVSIPPQLKRKLCKHCHSYLRPGASARVRLDTKNRTKIITCLNCNKITRIPYGTNKNRKKRAN